MEATFPHSYKLELLSEVSDFSLPHFYFPDASMKGGNDGLLVKTCAADGQAWLGTFAFGRVTPHGLSGLYTTPNPERFCVVAKGAAYLVLANAPDIWENVRANPVIDVRAIPTHGIIVFSDFTRMWAYGSLGLKWKTGRLAWNGLTITEVTHTSIRGEFWNAPTEAMATFLVDLVSGLHEGGVKEI
jgi:hypothetical protein